MPGVGSQIQARLIFGNVQLSGHVTEPAELSQHYHLVSFEPVVGGDEARAMTVTVGDSGDESDT